MRDGSKVYVNLLNSWIKLFIKDKKNFSTGKYSQLKTTKYMCFEILRNNFINICYLKKALNLLKQIKDNKKVNFLKNNRQTCLN